ncbi:MAG: T9SS type A sorting domain-containing protein, partial [Bacteroidia bacterium]|nr:T9SS type A sorting domain-containing protein [Bacteroidia bacterium]
DNWISQLQVYPNPVQEQLRLQFPIDLPFDATLIWRNALGQIIQQQTLAAGNNQYMIQCPERTGLYVLQIQLGNQQTYFKIQVCR